LCPPGTIPDNVTFSGKCGPPPSGPFTITPTQTAFNGQTVTITSNPFFFVFGSRSTNNDLLLDYETGVGPAATIGVSYVQSRNSVANHDFETFMFAGTTSTSNFGNP